MYKNKLLISEDKQDIVEVIATNGCEISCDNKPMKELIANSTDAAQEKHVPQFQINGNIVKVDVGSVKHPMDEAHLIGWVYIVTNQGAQRKFLKANTEPVIEFALCPGEELQEVYAYCNLHGLWMTKAQ